MRPPAAPLRPFVQLLWAMDERSDTTGVRATRELMLPTGTAHVVIRLSDEPLRLFESVGSPEPITYKEGVVGGPRCGPYVRGTGGPCRSVGAMLHPGAAVLLFGVPATELEGRHFCLDELWGADVR